MIRWMAQSPRLTGEAWVERKKRTTHEIEAVFHANGSVDWVSQQIARVWKLAGQTAASDHPKWSKRLLMWRPWFRVVPCWCVGHPFKRWDDEIVQLVGGDWPRVANDCALWASLLTGYVEHI